MSLGKIYLIPTPLGDNDPMEVLPFQVKDIIESLHFFIVENEKTARHFIKKITPEKKQSELHFMLIDKHTTDNETIKYLDVCKEGNDVGIMSEAGLPAIADPGAFVVKKAHQLDIQVVPIVGPSSIFLAMMSSGFNGQNFAFNGYLPIDENERKSQIKLLEKKSGELLQSQIFIETPYRNDKLLDSLAQTLHPDTKLCIAADITLPTEFIKTKSIQQWKKEKPELHKRPAIFIIQK
jgi:16S rRNA (cytidine1402-2'-O)-methyltransferase